MKMNSGYTFQKIMLLLLIFLFAVLALGLWYFLKVPFLLTYLMGINGVTLTCYGMDKFQSIHSGWRIPEITLHGLALIGGSPGALAGQLLFHHKTRKWRFRIVFFLIVIVQAAALLLIWIQRNPN